LAAELLQKYGNTIEELTLIPSGGGVFEIEKNGKRLFSKKQSGRFPEEGEIIQLIEAP